MELAHPDRLLLVDPPRELARLFEEARGEERPTLDVTGDAIRSVKESFGAVLVWREHRGGSRAIFDGALKRLAPGGPLWVVTALKKVRGPVTPAVHRLELSDLVKAFEKEGFTHDREVRVSAWHTASTIARCCAAATASCTRDAAPSAAVTTRKPSRWRYSPTTSTIVGSSSTIRMVSPLIVVCAC